MRLDDELQDDGERDEERGEEQDGGDVTHVNFLFPAAAQRLSG
jgi:hypothetical protein